MLSFHRGTIRRDTITAFYSWGCCLPAFLFDIPLHVTVMQEFAFHGASEVFEAWAGVLLSMEGPAGEASAEALNMIIEDLYRVCNAPYKNRSLLLSYRRYLKDFLK